MKRPLFLIVLLCTPTLLLAPPPLLAQPAPGAVTPAAPPQPDIVALLKQADAAQEASKFEEARGLYEQVLARARAVKDRTSEGNAIDGIGLGYANLGQLQKALEFYSQALPLFRETGNKGGEARVLSNIGLVYNNLGQPQKALEFYNQALPLLRETGNKQGEGDTLNSIGLVYANIGQPQQALESLNQALPLNREVGDKQGEAATLTYIGLVYNNLGQPQKALEFYNQALPLFRETGNKQGEANTLSNTGVVYADLGQPQKALEFYNQALPILREIGNKQGEANTLSNIGGVHADIGQPQRALEFFNQALPLRREVGDKSGEASTLSSIGVVYADLGQPQKALEFYSQALPLRREVGDKSGEASTLASIGGVYTAIGQPQKALEFFNQVLPLVRETGNKGGEAVTLTNIGLVYANLGQPQKALEFFNQALPIHRETSNKGGEASTLTNIGAVYTDNGQPQKAREFYNQALPLFRETGNKGGEATTLTNIGVGYASIGQPQKALEFYNQALPLLREVGDKPSEAVTLSNIGEVEELQGQSAQAGNRLRAALRIYEEIRETLGASSENKVSYLQQYLPTYHRYINLLLKQNKRTEAFEWTQKTKARALLDLMSSGKVDISKGTSPRERAREQELKRRIGQLNRQLLDEAVAHNPDKKARLKALKEQGAQAQGELTTFTDALYAKYPELARKRAARTVSLQEVARFLPPDTALLGYVVLKWGGKGKQTLDKTVLFCITTQNGKASVSTYSIAATRQQLIRLSDDFRAACADPKQDPRHQARALYNLLVAPAAPQLAGKKRLVVCPDGPLWGLPFQALMTPNVKGQKSGSRFLIEQCELDYAYSATAAQAALLAGQTIVNQSNVNQSNSTRSIKRGKGGGIKSSGTLLVLANPNFGGPERLAEASGSASAPRPITVGSRPITAGSRPITVGSRPITVDSRALTADSRALNVDLRAAGTDILGRNGAITPLPGTQLEADAIKANFPLALIRTGSKAQESTAKAEAPRYRFLHFATHGFFNDASPLDSAIVLAQPPASGVGSEDDGLLTAREIFDLNWPAELVVLSACNTARGGQSAGEGVVGLSWALFVAGAPSQVLSQWAVADASTAQLMKGLYSNLGAGQPKGAALRSAALALMQDGKHGHPFYWAPFVLIGDWR